MCDRASRPRCAIAMMMGARGTILCLCICDHHNTEPISGHADADTNTDTGPNTEPTSIFRKINRHAHTPLIRASPSPPPSNGFWVHAYKQRCDGKSSCVCTCQPRRWRRRPIKRRHMFYASSMLYSNVYGIEQCRLEFSVCMRRCCVLAVPPLFLSVNHTTAQQRRNERRRRDQLIMIACWPDCVRNRFHFHDGCLNAERTNELNGTL